jgi:hypothetical protein
MKTQQTIPYYNCKVGNIYILNSRNLGFGVFTGAGTFIGLRTKFENVFLDKELHVDRGGTARPLYHFGSVPNNIPLATSLGTYDEKTGKEVEFDKPIVDGGRGWYFVDTEVPSRDIMPCSKGNTLLFNYLKNVKVMVDMIDQYANLSNSNIDNLGFSPGTLNPVKLIDLPENPTVAINDKSSKKLKEALIEWMTRGNMIHNNKESKD